MGRDATAIRTELQADLGQIARQLGRKVYPEGLPRGTKFSDLEAIAGTLGDEIARQLIETHVQEQADGWADQEPGACPECGGPTRTAPDQSRALTTTQGKVAWKEHVEYCPRCRRAFFPSKPSVGS
jgi:predicted nucleic acid-binding Zn ribbon protein